MSGTKKESNRCSVSGCISLRLKKRPRGYQWGCKRCNAASTKKPTDLDAFNTQQNIISPSAPTLWSEALKAAPSAQVQRLNHLVSLHPCWYISVQVPDCMDELFIVICAGSRIYHMQLSATQKKQVCALCDIEMLYSMPIQRQYSERGMSERPFNRPKLTTGLRFIYLMGSR